MPADPEVWFKGLGATCKYKHDVLLRKKKTELHIGFWVFFVLQAVVGYEGQASKL